MSTPSQHAVHELFELHIELTLLAPWLVHGNDPGQLGLDAVQLRAPDGKRRILPGTLLAGRVREAWLDWRAQGLSAVPDPAAWFGPAATADEDEDAASTQAGSGGGRRQPQRTRIHVDDLTEVQDTAVALSPATRVPIDEGTGAGVEGMLVTVEQREAPGARIVFQGVWRAWLNAAESDALLNALGKALRWQTQVGALRSIGFGEVADVRLGKRVAATTQAAAEVRSFAHAPAGSRRAIALSFDRPLVINSSRPSDNLFESSDVVPGAAIKAALIHACRMRGLATPVWFDALRITHAVPSAGDQRPQPLPLSWVSGKDRQGAIHIWDASRDKAAPIDANGHAASFQIDWKDAAFEQARHTQGWGRTRRHLRVRTAIDGGRAKMGSLFAYDAVLADHNETTGQQTRWLATLHLPEAHDTAQNWQQLGDLLNAGPLGPIGKTDAFARAQLLPHLASVWPSGEWEKAEQLTLLLVSPALLTPLSALDGHSSAKPVDLLAIYRAAFAECERAVCGDGELGLQLEAFFAHQTLAGGTYLHRRFKPGQAYQPYVLTQAGSVFCFRVGNAERAKRALAAWQAQGLPISAAVANEHGKAWDDNPFIPENGYGEICIDPQLPYGAAPWAQNT